MRELNQTELTQISGGNTAALNYVVQTTLVGGVVGLLIGAVRGTSLSYSTTLGLAIGAGCGALILVTGS